MKTKAVSEDEDEPRNMRSSRSKRRRPTRRASSTESESPPRKRSKKPGKRTPADKKSKRSKVGSSSRRRRRSPSPSPSLSSSSSSDPSSESRSCSTCSSSSSEQSVSPSPPRSRSRDVKKRKGRGRDRDRERRKARRSTSASTSTSSRSGSRSRNKSSKRWTKDGDKIGKDYKNVTDSFDRDEQELVAAKQKGRDYGTEGHEENVSLEKTENPPSKSADGTEDVLPAADGLSPVAEDLELILRQKALENFIKFRAAAAMAGKTDNGAARNESLTDSPQNAATKVTEARSASITPFRRQASGLGARHPTESPKPEDRGNGTSPWMRSSSTGMSCEAGPQSRLLKVSDTGGSTQQEGSMTKAIRLTSQHRTPQDGRNSRSVMQRLVHTPGSASSVTRRLGSSVGVSHVNAAPRIKSVVSIPTREELDGGSSAPQRPSENPAPVESSDDVRYTPIDNSTKAEGTSEDGRKTSEPSSSNGSILSSADGKAQVTEPGVEGAEGSQLQKKTFSRMHDGETVEVSYKVYIPKKTPALERRKLQR